MSETAPRERGVAGLLFVPRKDIASLSFFGCD